MNKTAFLFPGQGSQEIGMGRDLFKEKDSLFLDLIERGSDYTGEDLERLCMRGPEKKLILARYLQPLLTAVSLAYHRRLVDAGITADIILGHSLGEITALAAAGVVSAKESVIIAAERGILMDTAATHCDGGMMAVLYTPLEIVEELLTQINQPNRLVLANDNAPNQIILSGEHTLLQQFADMLAEREQGKTKKINVAGPWHSPFMKEARVAFEEWAEKITFHRPQIPIILNATAKPETHPTTIKHLVTWQLTSPVFFRECLEYCRDAAVNVMYEIGPGRVLSGLARVNGLTRETTICNINNLRGIEKAVSAE